MNYLPGLLKQKLKHWTGRKWYHQRFDGSPYLLHLIAEAEIVTHTERKQGGEFTVHYCFFEDGKADWYIEMEDIKKVYTSIINAGRKDKNISKTLLQQWKKDEGLFYQKCREIENIRLSQLSNEELMKLHDDFVQITLDRNSSSSLIDGFALGTDELIAAEIKKVYDQSKLKENMKFTEAFSILTAPIHLSFINDAEVELLRIAVEVQKKPQKRKQLLQEHQQKFFWIRNNYVSAYVLSVEHFNEELGKILALKIDIEDKIKKIEHTPLVNKAKKKELLRELNLPEELKLLLTISEDFTYWQDERKKATFWTAHYCTLLLDEMGKHVKIPADELKYMSPREVSSIFIQKPDRKILQERRKNSVFYWDKEGHDVLTGKDADEVKKTILGSTDLSHVDDFRGLTASLGTARGTVKVVKSATEINKVKTGDILVAVMTRPDYVPAMKIAAAIVTDEGGITCHAAIVARELGIPCIIGTKIATKILKDGMQVEVNANHGWVRIYK